MGGNSFENTKRLNIDEYNLMLENINQLGLKEGIEYVYPYRLDNKKTFGDIDIILSEPDKFIVLFENNNKIKEIKKIPLFEERFRLYSKHILTDKNIQIDLLMCWNKESIEITQIYYSYCFGNIFLKRLTDIVDRNLKFSYLGLFCSSNKFIIPQNIKYFQIDKNTRLIVDCEYIFNILDLNYQRYKNGFSDEFELLEYFSKSKYFNQINFKYNSKFKHDYSRLEPFANLVNLNLILVENLNK